MGTQLSMDTVIEIGVKLPDVNESPYFGVPALKLNGRMLACTPVNKSAEANSAVIAMGFEQRAALLKQHPAFCYVTDHYVPHSTMLIRLSKISRAQLQQTLRMAWEFVASKPKAPRRSSKVKQRSGRAPSAKFKFRVR